MKRHVQKTGVRKYFGADLVELQSEPLAALDAFFAQYGPCIVQGCEIAPNPAGTFDVAAGLVALEADDPDGARRVMVMPFPGASGVALPLYLTPRAQAVERVYGDGKVKPVAYAYTAQAAGVEPAAGVPHMALTAEGGNRFVDAVQYAGHRFISDAERSRWNRVLEQAKEYADSVAATGSQAAVRSAKEYTDTRETAILAAADARDAVTLTDAKAYADRIVAALAGSAPETLDTLQELAAALGNDPNFAATVLQLVGEKATMEQVDAALAGKVGYADIASDDPNRTTTGPSVRNNMSGIGVTPNYHDIYTLSSDGIRATQLLREIGNPLNFYIRGTQGWTSVYGVAYKLWHTGNFDPAGKFDKTGGEVDGDLYVKGHSGYRDGGRTWLGRDNNGAFFNSDDASGATTAQLRLWNNGRITFWKPGIGNDPYELWHSGNFSPAGCIQNQGMRVDISQEMIGTGFQYDTGGSGTQGPFLAFGSPQYPAQMVCGYWAGNGGHHNLKFRTRNGDTGVWNPWYTVYSTGNLGPATASADGLMSAADKAKLDTIGSGGMKLLGAGVVNGTSGGLTKRNGAVQSGSHYGTGYYRVFHNIGHTSYEVQATAKLTGNIKGGHVSVHSQTINYFDVWTADDDSANDLSFFFQIYEF